MIKLFEMFAGYGGASFSLKKANIDFECVGYSEIDKYAIQCFEQNHFGKNFGDCSKINTGELPDFDLLTGGFPCQDVSIAGNRNMEKGRTNLYLEIIRIAKAKKPKYLLLENVKGLLSMTINERRLVDKIVADLQKIGYGVCHKVLNSSDFGIPQNRERIWFVCKFGGWDFAEFQFPQKRKLEIVFRNILEKEVKERYFLKHHQLVKWGIDNITPETNLIIQPRSDEGLRISRDICPTLYNEMRGWTEGLWNTFIVYDGNSWRNFTEKEVFRLMGFFNDEINLEGIPNNQCYKLAGNGWDINVVSKIFGRMFK